MTLERLTVALSDRYRIDGVLGVGGMATVYRAEDLKHHREVAIKVMLPELAATMGAERFLREVEIAAKLSHPNILPVYDSGDADGLLYYVMPLVEEETLETRLAREKQLPVSEALRLARETAEALAYAHARGIVHRDIKPANILLNSRHAMVADFGIARATSALAGAGHALTQTGFAVGTPQYMSPEQASGDPNVDGRTDIYALGCVLYEMLVGEAPFNGPTPQAVIARSMSEHARPLQQTRPSISPAVSAVVDKAMAKTPADRFASAAEFAAALEAAEMTSAATHAPTIGTIGTAATNAGAAKAIDNVGSTRATAKRWPLLTAAAVVVVALAAVGMRYFTHTASASTVKSVAVLPFENRGSAEQGYLADGIVDELRDKLARLDSLTVIASSSADQYRQSTKSSVDIAKELRVDKLLMGKVTWTRGAGDARQVQVVTELVNGATGNVDWRQTFKADSVDALSIQGSIATAVASALGTRVQGDAARVLGGRGTKNDAAYDAYLKAMALRGIAPATSRNKAALLEQAVALDSSFARAWGALGTTLSELYYNGNRDRATGQRAKYAIDRMLRLAADTAGAHAAAATYYHLVENDRVASRRELDRALALDSNSAGVLSTVALADMADGAYERAEERLTRARVIDPRNRGVLGNLADAYVGLRRLDDAAKIADEQLTFPTSSSYTAEKVAVVHLARGDTARVREVVNATLPHNSAPEFVAYFAGYYELAFVLPPAERALLFRLTPAAFDDDRAWWAQSLAVAAMQQGDVARGRAYADSGLALSKKASDDHPDDTQARMLYAQMLAYTGHAVDATREAERALAAIDSTSMSGDATNIDYLRTVAVRVYLANGQLDKAMDQLERVVAGRSVYTREWLKIDPLLKPLRGNPRFERLLKGPQV